MPTVEGFFGAFSNPSRSPLTNYDTALFGDARVIQGWDFNPSRLVIGSGVVSRINPRKVGGQALVQAVVSKQAKFVASQADMGGRPALNLDHSTATMVYTPETNTIFPVNGDFSIIALQRMPTAAGTTFLGGGTGNTTGHTPTNGVGSSVQDTGIRVGASGAQASVVAPVTKDVPHLCIYTWDDSAKMAGVSIDGATFVTNTNAGAVSNDPTFSWGALISGTSPSPSLLGTLLITNCEFLIGNADLLTLIRKFTRDIFAANT